jgi:hypothetical protein
MHCWRSRRRHNASRFISSVARQCRFLRCASSGLFSLRALGNLLNNAVKFSPSGAPVAAAVATRDGYCIFSVQDRGPGIAQEDLARLFQRYHRVESGSVMRLQPGVGLGLVFVDAVARRHGGRVSVESRLGEGSRFELWIPLPAAGPRAGG